VKIARIVGGAAAVVALAGCGGATKTVVQTVSVARTPTSASTTSSTAATASTPSGPPTCASVFQPSDIRPVVCSFQTGSFVKGATENYPIRLKTLTAQFVAARTASSVADSSGAATATATGTFLIITLRISNNSSTPQTVESIGNSAAELFTLGSDSKQYSESFAAENQADEQSFVSQNSTPIQPDASQTGDVVFDLPPSALASVRAHGAGLLLGDFGVDLSSAGASNDPSTPFAFMIIHHAKLQG
jgi:hypothetical protein